MQKGGGMSSKGATGDPELKKFKLTLDILKLQMKVLGFRCFRS